MSKIGKPVPVKLNEIRLSRHPAARHTAPHPSFKVEPDLSISPRGSACSWRVFELQKPQGGQRTEMV